MNAYLPSKNELELIIAETVKKTMEQSFPAMIRKATRKQWLTTNEVMNMLQCSRRHIQYLRNSEQLPYSQNGRTIRYKVQDVEDFLNNHRVE